MEQGNNKTQQLLDRLAGNEAGYERCSLSNYQRLQELLDSGAVPTAVLLREDDDAGEWSVSFYTKNHSTETAPSLPVFDSDLYDSIYARMGCDEAPKTIGLAPMETSSDVRICRGQDQKTAKIVVVRAGWDVEQAVLKMYRWMLHIGVEHITLIAPLQSPHVAQAVNAWKGFGLIFSGLLPSAVDGDYVLYQGGYQNTEPPADVLVPDGLIDDMRQRVEHGWYQVRDMHVEGLVAFIDRFALAS